MYRNSKINSLHLNPPDNRNNSKNHTQNKFKYKDQRIYFQVF